MVLLSKAIPEFELYHAQQLLGRFRVVSEWQGFKQIKRVNSNGDAYPMNGHECVAVVRAVELRTKEQIAAGVPVVFGPFEILEASPAFKALYEPSPCS